MKWAFWLICTIMSLITGCIIYIYNNILNTYSCKLFIRIVNGMFHQKACCKFHCKSQFHSFVLFKITQLNIYNQFPNNSNHTLIDTYIIEWFWLLMTRYHHLFWVTSECWNASKTFIDTWKLGRIFHFTQYFLIYLLIRSMSTEACN